MGIKMIYKKTLAVNLIKAGHDLEYTTRNRANKKYQCFAFIDTPELRKDLAKLTGNSYDETIIGK